MNKFRRMVSKTGEMIIRIFSESWKPWNIFLGKMSWKKRLISHFFLFQETIKHFKLYLFFLLFSVSVSGSCHVQLKSQIGFLLSGHLVPFSLLFLSLVTQDHSWLEALVLLLQHHSRQYLGIHRWNKKMNTMLWKKARKLIVTNK